ncbi:NAC domain-containing protein [Gorgonomyces haynaldii]|nr:NAC domain-containing protein [Gorgonomyces haynaldii]
MDQAKLAKLQSQVRIGGKGTPRRKVKKVVHTSGGDDKKLASVLKKLNVQQVTAIEEVNMFKDNGSVLHFVAPKVQASVASNTFVISGPSQEMTMTQVISENPAILTQLGAGNMQQLAQQMGQMKVEENDDDVPDLVDAEAFDQMIDENKQE